MIYISVDLDAKIQGLMPNAIGFSGEEWAGLNNEAKKRILTEYVNENPQIIVKSWSES